MEVLVLKVAISLMAAHFLIDECVRSLFPSFIVGQCSFHCSTVTKANYSCNLLNFLPPYAKPIVRARMAINSKSYICSLYHKIPSQIHNSIEYSNPITVPPIWLGIAQEPAVSVLSTYAFMVYSPCNAK